MVQSSQQRSVGFEALGLSSKLSHALNRAYNVPTPFHEQLIPRILSGGDYAAEPKVYSKPLPAILGPILEKLKRHMPQGGVRALILYPTDDRAREIFRYAEELGLYVSGIRTGLLVSGDTIESQLEKLALNPDLIIATPNSLLHHLDTMSLSLRTVEYVAFAEALRFIGMGFGEKLHQILGHLSENRQTLLFANEFTEAVRQFAHAALRDPVFVMQTEVAENSRERSLGFTMVASQQQQDGFEVLGLSSKLSDALKCKEIVPNAFHEYLIPRILSGGDYVAVPKKGAEEWVAILGPMLEKLKQHMPQGGIRALILYNTDDWARQNFKFAQYFILCVTDIRTGLLVSEDSMESQLEKLALNPDVIFATPDSLLHHLGKMSLSLHTVEYVVFDDARRLLRMGFEEKLHQILGHLSENRQTLLFARRALTESVRQFARAALRDPVFVRETEIWRAQSQKLALTLSSLTIRKRSNDLQVEEAPGCKRSKGEVLTRINEEILDDVAMLD